jgi:hypothetical protein
MIKNNHIIFIILIIIATIFIIKKKPNNKFTSNQQVKITESIKNLSLITSQILDTTNQLKPNVTIPSELIITDELYINNKKMETIEPGTIISYCLDDIPDGWVECDGKWYLLSKYSDELINLPLNSSNDPMSYKYIKSPDLRDRFILSYNYDINDETSLNQYGGDDKIKIEHLPDHKHFYNEKNYVKQNEFYEIPILNNIVTDFTQSENRSNGIMPSKNKSTLKKEIKGTLTEYNNFAELNGLTTFDSFNDFLKDFDIDTDIKDMFLPNQVTNYYPPYCVLKYIMKI